MKYFETHPAPAEELPFFNLKRSPTTDLLVIGSGQPIPGTKRFVTPGSSVGTSVASFTGRKILPQRMPFRILKTSVVGGALGRAVPYVGWLMLAYDIADGTPTGDFGKLVGGSGERGLFRPPPKHLEGEPWMFGQFGSEKGDWIDQFMKEIK